MLLPRTWRSIPIRAVARRREESERPDLPLLSVYREIGVVPREGRDDNFNKPGMDLAAYKVVHPGDLVLNKMKTWQGSLAVSVYHGIVSPAYFVCELNDRVHPRFLHYQLRSRPYIAAYAARSKGIRPQQWDLPWDAFKSIRLAVPSLEEQSAIADFLDRETARIDALLERKRQMMELIGERARRIADSVIWAEVDSEIPLMYAVDALRPVMYGIVLPGPDVPEGVPIVKGGDVSAHRLTPDQLCRTTNEIEAPYARARLRAGDVLFAIRGGVGDAAMVPMELEGGNITQDVARIAPVPEFRSDWLLEVMRTQTVQRRASHLITGATITGLNIRDLERIRIPWSRPERQEADLATLQPLLVASERLERALGRQVELLAEHRQALITAAVTGQMQAAEAP